MQPSVEGWHQGPEVVVVVVAEERMGKMGRRGRIENRKLECVDPFKCNKKYTPPSWVCCCLLYLFS